MIKSQGIELMKKKATGLRRRAQRGVSLLFALMGLVVLTLGAVALLRSVDTGLLVLGNLGFKQDALAAGSVGTEAAITWLQNSTADTLKDDHKANGYSSVAVPALEAAGPRADAPVAKKAVLIDWLGNGCAVPGLNGREVVSCLAAPVEVAAAGGNKVSYFILRLCAKSGLADTSNDCVLPVVQTGGGSTSQRGSLGYGSNVRFQNKSAGTYYRVITRTEGARGTVSYTETLVHF